MTGRPIPFIYTIVCATAFCGTVWKLADMAFERWPVQTFLALLATIILCLIILVIPKRTSETDLVDFIDGKTAEKPAKPAPLVPHNVKNVETGQFVPRQPILHAALRRDVEAK